MHSVNEPFILGQKAHVEAAFLSVEEFHSEVGRNSGNLVFSYAIDAHLGGNIRNVRWSDPVDIINRAGAAAVLPAANHLGRHFDLVGQANKLREVTVPIVAVGLGAQSNLQRKIPPIPDGTVDWIRVLADHAPSGSPNIGVRGPFSLEVLDHLGLADHAVIIGCPSLFINPNPTLGKQVAEAIRTPDRIAVTAGNPGWTHLQGVETQLAKLVSETNGSYIGQSPLEMMWLTRGRAHLMEDESLHRCRNYIHQNMDVDTFIDWTIRYGNVFADTQSWLEHYRRFDFVIGTRIHGAILGLQAGIPSMCIVHDSRTSELCETLKIPHLFATDIANGISRDDLVRRFNFDASEFDRNRRDLCRRYIHFLSTNGIAVVGWLKDIAGYRQYRESKRNIFPRSSTSRTSFVIGLRPRLDTAFLSTEKLSTMAGENTGNLVYAHAICKQLPDHARVLDIGAPPEQMNRAGHTGVIQGANQLGTHFSHHRQADRFSQLDINLVAIGLGAQSVSQDVLPELPSSAVEWVRRIVERAPSAGPNIAVRGEFTVKVLERYGLADRAEVVGCPSLFLSPDPRLGQEIARNQRAPRRVAVAAGHASWHHLAPIEASLARLVTQTGGSYIGQHDVSMIALTRGDAAQMALDDLRRCRDYICPNMPLSDFISWSRTYGNVFFDVSAWIEHCRRFDFVVGTRIHGIVVALQAGVPALCIAHDSRTLELCRTMKVPHVRAEDVNDGIACDDLHALADFDPDEFDENRRNLCRRYTAFLRNNSLNPATWLEKLGNA